MEVPMLDDEEFAVASKLYRSAFSMTGSGLSVDERMQPLLDYYEKLTGFKETVPNAIMHHQISQYGPPCKSCGKPYRTKEASFCASCGHKQQKINKIHLVTVLLINILIVSKLIHFSWVGNDKAILVVGFYYFILILLNMGSWLVLDYFKRKAARIYKITTTGLVILIIPILLITTLH